MNHFSGVVEGFYWPQSESVFGHYGSFSLSQRLQLFHLLSELDLGVYWYAPQSISTMDVWNSTQISEWTKSSEVSSSFGIRLVYGLRPGFLDSNHSSIISKVQEIHDCGIRSYSLSFDDASGTSTFEQKTRQISLASTLISSFPDMTLYAFTPSEYYQTHDGPDTSLYEWSISLETVDESLNGNVPFCLTGPSINPSNMSPSMFPSLSSGRRKMFWDNWIAVDTSIRLPWGLIDGRINETIFSSSYGYVLNMAFPLERNIHQLACLSEMAANDQSKTHCETDKMAKKWSAWLVSNGFAHNHTQTSLSSALSIAIDEDMRFDSIQEMENAYPDLVGVFSLPPENFVPNVDSLPEIKPSNNGYMKDVSISLILFSLIAIIMM
jgi:hypothetical protein